MKKRPFIIFIIFITIIIIIFFDRSGKLNNLRNFVYSQKNSFFANFRIISFWRSGEKRILQLENLYQSCIVDKVNGDQLKNENEILKKQLGIGAPEGKKIILTKVIDAYAGVMRLEKPAEKINIPENAYIIKEKVLIGKVKKTENDYITVLLPTNNEFKQVATTQTTSAKGIVTGNFLTGISFDKVLIDQKLDTGDKIISWPEQYLIGEINKVERKDQELFQKATVRPSIDYYQLSEVFIVL